ncbi:MAG TPA: RNA polymerase sigma-70 factor [Gemmatimonadales bacterium]|nr:RNA polymerase sigma-70 factor [Gemmatimonadales bacterium]
MSAGSAGPAPRSAASTDATDARDRAWVARVRTGDVPAFEALFRAYCEPLCEFVKSYVDSRDVAEELVQELFCRLWDQRHTWEVPGSVKNYLFKAARNRAYNHLRHRRVEEAFQSRALDPSAAHGIAAPAPADRAVEAGELQSAVQRAIDSLPSRCREVFVLHRDHHFTYGDIARMLEISPKTVEIHMSRALAALRTQLARWRE